MRAESLEDLDRQLELFAVFFDEDRGQVDKASFKMKDVEFFRLKNFFSEKKNRKTNFKFNIFANNLKIVLSK